MDELRISSIARTNFNVGGSVYYVAQSGLHIPPFANWVNAATNIQAAIDVAQNGDTVLVTNGVYDTGGIAVNSVLTNRIAITKAITVRSVNGPQVTSIVGKEPLGNTAVRCAYVGSNACLVGFTLTNGYTQYTNDSLNRVGSGGGVWCESVSAVLSNCVLTGNRAYCYGGGAYGGTLFNCTLTGNSASTVGNGGGGGGGACYSTLYNCMLTDNGVWYGDGGGGGV